MAGKLVHFEFPVQDPDRETKFFAEVFGWELKDSGMPDMDYRMVQTGEDQGGAVYKADGDANGVVIYFDSDDIDATIAKVRANGGEADDKQPIPGIGWFAGCKDPEGNAFSLYQRDESAAPPR
ncbi:MAG TPA: VOC family protein [Gaiellaceae bacterium]|jgi:predicted enzyme related to lactoylglutathione lyase|nr:VOC family protein [Gaiellaceae bacterium]